jgi:hypothetical protein
MVISFSPLYPGVASTRSRVVSSQLVEHHVSQVVQRFSKLQRIDQGTAGPVVAVKAFQVLSRKQEGGDPPAVVSDPHFGQLRPAAQQKRTFEQIGHFESALQRDLTSFQALDL